MITRKHSLVGFGAAVLLGAVIITAAAWYNRANAATSVDSGDIIRGQSFSAVYYMGADGFRYVFPNDKAYFTWYTDFDDVVWITDAELAVIQIGGNVTYKPGSKMIKINTDPKVYYVGHNGDLYSVASEASAASLFGSNWNQQIHDVPDGFFGNYTITGDDVDSEIIALTAPSSSYTINEDKNLVAPETMSITSNGYSPIDVEISAGQTVTFTNNDTAKHTVTADDLTWGSGTLNAGESFTRRFSEEGTFSFFDSYDSTNSGAVYVN
ncbi:MAG: cupredoxin domain-containing protein, partial [Candidatus Uhrbacteria bacterium]|nr:cupredoxin domain-containing protein [Candidatus Uhrbacteria bacterium]